MCIEFPVVQHAIRLVAVPHHRREASAPEPGQRDPDVRWITMWADEVECGPSPPKAGRKAPHFQKTREAPLWTAHLVNAERLALPSAVRVVRVARHEYVNVMTVP